MTVENVLSAFADMTKACLAKKRGKSRTAITEVTKKIEAELGILVSFRYQLSTDLWLIAKKESKSLSSTDSERLVKAFRQPLASLYSSSPQAALAFAAGLAGFLYHSKILVEYASGNYEQRGRWERVLNALLSGVLVR